MHGEILSQRSSLRKALKADSYGLRALSVFLGIAFATFGSKGRKTRSTTLSRPPPPLFFWLWFRFFLEKKLFDFNFYSCFGELNFLPNVSPSRGKVMEVLKSLNFWSWARHTPWFHKHQNAKFVAISLEFRTSLIEYSWTNISPKFGEGYDFCSALLLS